MRCAVCGMDYGLSHNCSGIAPLPTDQETAPPPVGFSPGYYLRRPSTLCAGMTSLSAALRAILTRSITAPSFGSSPRHRPDRHSSSTNVGRYSRLRTCNGYWCDCRHVCWPRGCGHTHIYPAWLVRHLIAKWFFGGTGSYLGVMRPLLLGWFVTASFLFPSLERSPRQSAGPLS